MSEKTRKVRFPSRKGDGPGRKFHSPTGNAPPDDRKQRSDRHGNRTLRSEGRNRPGRSGQNGCGALLREPRPTARPEAPLHGTPPARKPDSRRPETTGSPDERLKPTDRTTGRMTCRNAAAPNDGRDVPFQRDVPPVVIRMPPELLLRSGLFRFGLHLKRSEALDDIRIVVLRRIIDHRHLLFSGGPPARP